VGVLIQRLQNSNRTKKCWKQKINNVIRLDWFLILIKVNLFPYQLNFYKYLFFFYKNSVSVIE